jgi:hypothetical protein
MKTFKIIAGLLLALTVILVVNSQVRVYLNDRLERQQRDARQQLFDELTPVALTCRFKRSEKRTTAAFDVWRSARDAKAGYQMASGYDQWGCDI